MPKITIKEYDETTAGIGQYTNFAVVVPGLVADGVDDSVFDENGIYECNSKKKFLEHIGKVAAGEMITTHAVKPTLVSWDIIDEDSEDSGEEDYVKIITIDEFNAAKESSLVYLCKAEERTDGGTDYGYLYDESYNYTMVETSQYDASSKYALISATAPNGTGLDEEHGNHYGNQMAWELISLGYTVIYKRFKEHDSLGDDLFWEPLKDKATYDFRYIVNGLISGNDAANRAIINLAEFNNKTAETGGETGRGDCVALIDIDSTAYKGKSTAEAIRSIKGKLPTISSKYAAAFAPYVVYDMAVDSVYQDTTFPASFHYLACAARAAETYNEWYAIAGYTRGISKYSILETGVKLGDSAVDIFEPRYIKDGVRVAINLIVKIRGSYYLWGNRTLESLGENGSENGDLRASHFLNIRQLCTTIKKQTYVACRRFTFDPNSDILWINFCNAIRPTLEKMKADQGIRDYKFIKVITSQKGVLKAKIRIVPIEAVEDFDISLYLEDSLGGIIPEIEEE